MDRLSETLKILNGVKQHSDSIMVSFSGGKDSCAVLDMCVRAFDHVEAFFLYFLPGLECAEAELEKARKRWGVTIHQYPHWVGARALRSGVFRAPSYQFDDLPDYKLRDIYDLVIRNHKIPMIATGNKKADSLWRRRNLSTIAHYTDVCHPIIGWSMPDVLTYLGKHNIPRPSGSATRATGIDLSTPSLLWMHDTHPADFKRICEVFPFAEAVVWRRSWYGVE